MIYDLGTNEDWQTELIKYADDTVLVEKLNTKSEGCFKAGQK